MRIQFEKVLLPLESTFACREYRESQFDCPYHFHPEIEILLIESSTGQALIGDTPVLFRPGQVYLIADDLPHMFRNDSSSVERNDVAQSRFIQFLRDCLGSNFWALPENRPIASLLQAASRGILWDGSAARRVADYYDRVYEENGPRRLARFIELLDVLGSIAGEGRQLASSGYRPGMDKTVSARLNKVLEYVHLHLAQEISTEKAAELAGLSASGFQRFFRRSIGRSFIDYVIEQRLTIAHRLLLESDLTVAEVCFRCGFENLSNFNRHFRARSGSTPSAWRRRTVCREDVNAAWPENFRGFRRA